MDLVRSWLGQALRATGAAVVVPLAILAALSLTAIGGSGLGGLGALSQIVSGPRAAGGDLAVDTGDAEIGDAVTQLAATGGPTGAAVPGTVPSGAGGGGGGSTPGGALRGPGGGNGPGGRDGIEPISPGGGGGDGGGGGGTPEPPPPERPGVVEGVGQTVTDVTGGTPVGPTVEDAVDGLVEVCGRLGCP